VIIVSAYAPLGSVLGHNGGANSGFGAGGMTVTLPPWSTQGAAELLQPLSRTIHRII
jgi:hypothetical protein